MRAGTTKSSHLRTGLAAVLLMASAAVSASDSAQWMFDVALDNRVVGSHKFSVTHHNGQTLVNSDARFTVKFLFITAFEYAHNNVERWAENCLQEIEAATNSNGKITEVKGELVDSVLHVETGDDRENIDGCVRSFAYWNPAILEANYLLNPQTGEYLKIDVAQLENEQVSVGGGKVNARAFRLVNDHPDENKRVNIKVWYAQDSMQWLGLQSTIKGGRVLEYRAVSLPQSTNVVASANFFETQSSLQSETF